MYNAARENSKPGYRSWITRQRDPNIINSGTALLDHHPIIRSYRHGENLQDSSFADSLGNLIKSCHRQHCSDPRDYVFGLVGLHPCPRLEINYAFSNEEVAVRALQQLQEEGALKSLYHLGIDLLAASALLKALTVTSLTYSTFERTLPFDRLGAMQMRSFHLLFKPMVIMTAGDDVLQPEGEAYESVVQLPVSGSLMKNVFLMKRSDFLQVRLLDGRFRQFTYVRDSNQLERKPSVVLLCFLGSSFIIVHWDPVVDGKISMKHFTTPDTTRQVHEAVLFIEIKLPMNVREALQRERNLRHIDWNDIHSDISPNSFLRLSTMELISLCELIAP